MKRFRQKIRRFLVSEDGPAAVEYAVMIGMILMACISVVSSVGQSVNTAFSRTANSVGEIAK